MHNLRGFAGRGHDNGDGSIDGLYRIEDGVDLPEPSDYETAKAKSIEYYRELEIPPHPGTLYLLVPADPKREPFVRLNISMQPRLLAKVDRKAKSEGMTRSGFLATAAQNYINQLDAM